MQPPGQHFLNSLDLGAPENVSQVTKLLNLGRVYLSASLPKPLAAKPLPVHPV